jgi:hypothetical protein
MRLPAPVSKPLAPLALTSAVGFALLNVGRSIAPRARWVQVVGVGAHALLLPLTARLAAPDWVRAMGYGWVAVDGAASIAVLGGKAPASVMPVRLGGHLLAAAWLVGAAQSLPQPARWLGLLAASCLGGHTLLAPFTQHKPPVLLYASGPLLVGWLGALSYTSPAQRSEGSGVRRH